MNIMAQAIVIDEKSVDGADDPITSNVIPLDGITNWSLQLTVEDGLAGDWLVEVSNTWSDGRYISKLLSFLGTGDGGTTGAGDGDWTDVTDSSGSPTIPAAPGTSAQNVMITFPPSVGAFAAARVTFTPSGAGTNKHVRVAYVGKGF